MSTLVIDPGHGGTLPVGGSSPNRATGPNGLLEKDVTLDIAQRLQRLLTGSGDVVLTRGSDVNLALAARARTAREHNASLFLSLHLNGSEIAASEGCAAWIARQASPASRALAESLASAIATATGTPNLGVRQRDLGVLLPSRLAPETAACLLEIDYLTNPVRARSLANGDYRQKLAEAMNTALRRQLNPLSVAQAVVGAGRAVVDCPLLNSHGATSKNLILRWNVPPMSLELVDVAVHFHGYSESTLNLPGKETTSGLDPANRTRLLLGLIPRGKKMGLMDGSTVTYKYDFPELTDKPNGMRDLATFGLDWFAGNQLSQPAGTLKADRRILTAHSGGGARMQRTIPSFAPDEVMFFDAIYGVPDAAVKWVTARIAQDAAALSKMSGLEQWQSFMRARGGALRCVINPKSSHIKPTTVLHDAIECELNRVSGVQLRAVMSRYYRVEKSDLEHSDIPKTFGPQLMKDASADLTPAVTRLPAPSSCGGATSKASSVEGGVPCIPARPNNAKTGREIIKLLYSEDPPNDWVNRENIFYDEITGGNIPAFLRNFKEVKVSFTEKNGTAHSAVYKVMPDVLCIGNNLDFFRVPMDSFTAQRVADAFCCLLPTAKMVWDIYQYAGKSGGIQAVAITRGYNDPKSKIKGTSMAAYAEHSDAIESALPSGSQGKLVEGHKKMVVISNLRYQPQIPQKLKDGTIKYVDGRKLLAFYGWFTKDGKPIQGGVNGSVSMAHDPAFADYSQGVRLVHPEIIVDGKSRAVSDILADPVLHSLLSNEGPVQKPRIPGTR